MHLWRYNIVISFQERDCLRREVLKTKGLLNEDGDLTMKGNNDSTTTQRRNYFRAVFSKQRSADILPESEETVSLSVSKYIPPVESENVAIDRDRTIPLSTKYRVRQRLNKAVTKVRIINTVKPSTTKNAKLYNTLDASMRIVERHRLGMPSADNDETEREQCTDRNNGVRVCPTDTQTVMLTSRQNTRESDSPSDVLCVSTNSSSWIEKVTQTVLDSGIVTDHSEYNCADAVEIFDI